MAPVQYPRKVPDLSRQITPSSPCWQSSLAEYELLIYFLFIRAAFRIQDAQEMIEYSPVISFAVIGSGIPVATNIHDDLIWQMSVMRHIFPMLVLIYCRLVNVFFC